jgi:hypothetical protein
MRANMRRYRRPISDAGNQEQDPLDGMANLFDLAMVFAVALMVAMVSFFKISDLLTNDNVTYIKNPGKADMEIIVKKGKKIEKYKATNEKGQGRGEKIGVAYRLENGEIIYVPE